MNDGRKMMGWCKRTRAWVDRDEMLGLHVQIFKEDGRAERVTIRLYPNAHAELANELCALAWDNRLRTRDDVQAAGDPIVEVDAGSVMTDTAVWYAAQDERIVTRAVLRPAAMVTTLCDLLFVIGRAIWRVKSHVLWDVLAEERRRLPRWDACVVDLATYDDENTIGLSADASEVLVMRRTDERVYVSVVEHDLGELVLRASGVLNSEPPALTR